MDTESTIYSSPSFNKHSSNSIADIADRVVQQLHAENGFDEDDDAFCFSDDDNQTIDEVNTNNHTDTMNQVEEKASEEDEHEFEFPVICADLNSPIDESISPRYPVFDTTLLSDVDDSPKTDSKPSLVTVKRTSLIKLFNEDRDSSSTSTSTSTSNSSSESEELDGASPGTYCVWKPKSERRGKHKKSNSISIGITSNQWKVRDLLKRSYSDDNYSVGKDSPVLLFIPPISPEKEKKNDRSGKTSKLEKKIPAYKAKIGNIHLPPYLPYRQDQVAAFASFDGAKKNQYRY
ncbi:hypothetical protein QVD17_02476 [Tagetes erecta]|uniref:Uncharacterized protein n=1 Tax=Tagetes erecta TaxID=13708 RepID=A0AAD8L6N5_TARER|nr:hypothetical protein QVD17_02476 [Tagetes erecta]